MTSGIFLFLLPVTLVVTFVTAVSYSTMASVLSKQSIPIKTKNVAYFFLISAASSMYFALNIEGITRHNPYDPLGTIYLIYAIAFVFSFSWARGAIRFSWWSIPCSLLGGAIAVAVTLSSSVFLAALYTLIGLAEGS